jgi:hypothetical protein
MNIAGPLILRNAEKKGILLHCRRGLEVAVKRLVFSSLETPTPGARDARRRRAALHEAALNASLAHPNVVASEWSPV